MKQRSAHAPVTYTGSRSVHLEKWHTVKTSWSLALFYSLDVALGIANMGLEPLEFAECLTDSPSFREKLHDHEKELERTSKAIKALINDGKDLVAASKREKNKV